MASHAVTKWKTCAKISTVSSSQIPQASFTSSSVQKKCRLTVDSDVTTQDRQVALVFIESGDAWKQPPFFEAELPKQFQARGIVREDKTDDRGDPKRRRA